MADLAPVVTAQQAAVDHAVAVAASPAIVDAAQDALTLAQSYSGPPSFPTISGTTLAPLCMSRPVGYGGLGENVTALPSELALVWCGAAFDYATNRMYVVNWGGDGDRYQNEDHAIQVPNGPSWRINAQTPFPPDQHIPGVYEPLEESTGLPTLGIGYRTVSPQNASNATNPIINGQRVYFDGKPASRHTYGGTLWLAVQQAILIMGGAPWRGGSSRYCGVLDPATGVHTRKGNLPGNMNGIASAYDALRDRVMWNRNGLGSVYHYNPATDTHQLQAYVSGEVMTAGYGGPFVSMQIDPVTDYLYATSLTRIGPVSYTGNIVRLKLGQPSTPTPWVPIPVSGDTAAIFSANPGMEYDPDRHAFVFWAFNDPSAVTILNLDTFVATRVPISTAPAMAPAVLDPLTSPTKTGVWGKFRRYATNKYCLLVGANYPLYLMELP